MSKLFTLPAGRTAKYLLFVGWVVVIFVAAGPAQLTSKFSDAEKNESSSFLPGDAESTKALDVTKQLQGGEQAATVVVYRRDGGLTADDRAKIASDRGKLNAKRFRNTTPFGAATLSRDGTSALMVNLIEGDGESETILDPVDSYRKTVSDPRGGLEVKVTGASGYSADAIKVFENINGTLLLAAGALVFVLLILIYLVFLTEIGLVVAFGVMLDTFLVRSVLVPALVFDIGSKVWWPSTLAQAIDRRERFRPEADRLAEEHPDADGGVPGGRLEPVGGLERDDPAP